MYQTGTLNWQMVFLVTQVSLLEIKKKIFILIPASICSVMMHINYKKKIKPKTDLTVLVESVY